MWSAQDIVVNHPFSIFPKMRIELVTLLVRADLAREYQRLRKDAVHSCYGSEGLAQISHEAQVMSRPHKVQKSPKRRASAERNSLLEESKVMRSEKMRLFGESIRRFRHESGLSQLDLADRLSWSTELIEAIEAGKRRPHIESIDHLCDSLRLSNTMQLELKNQLKNLATIELGARHNLSGRTASKATVDRTPHKVRSAHSRAKKREQHREQLNARHFATLLSSTATPLPAQPMAELSKTLFELAKDIDERSQIEVLISNEKPHPSIIFDKPGVPNHEEALRSQSWTVEPVDNSHDDVRRALGLAVKEFRKERKLTQEQLARKIGASRQQVRNFETGQGEAPIPDLSLVAAALSINAEEIVERAQKKQIGSLPNLLLP